MFNFTEDHILVHQDIRMLIRNFLLDSTKDILHINSFAGSGKTTIASEELEDSGLCFIYLGGKHDIVSEQKEEKPAFNDLLQIESRFRLCESEEYKKLSKHGISIKHFCESCGKKDVCSYYVRLIDLWNETQCWLGVHHHLGGLVNGYVKEKDVDVVVIDEYFLNAIYKNFNMKKDLLIKAFTLIGGIIESDSKKIMINFIKIILNLLSVKKNEESETIYNLINSIKDFKEMYIFTDEFEVTLAEQYFSTGDIFENIITPLARMMENIYNYSKINTKTKTIKYIDNVIKFEDKTLPSGYLLKVLNISYYNLFALELNCKIIILDATTPSKFYEEVFGRPVRALSRNISLTTIFYQLSNGRYVMSTLDSPKSRAKARLLDITEKISKKHSDEKVLVVSRMKYTKEIESLNTNIKVDYYPLSATNEYDEFNVCVIFGTPEPRSDILKRKSILLNCDQKTLLYIERETSVIQAIHRTRISLKQDKQTYVYLLTNLELPFNTHQYTLKKMIELLSIESKFDKILEVEEDIIRSEIYEYLKIRPRKLTEIKNKIKNYSEFVDEVLDRMVNDKLLKKITPLRSSKGRPPTYYMLT